MSEPYNPEGKRGPGRPSNAEIAAREQPTRADEVKQERRRRQEGPILGLKLAVPEELKEPGYAYRWTNDKDGGGRIHNMTKLDDWDIVNEQKIEGTGEGTPVTRIVGKNDSGGPMKAYLLRKPQEYFDADRAQRAARLKEQEDSIKRGIVDDPKGLSGPSAYVPEGGISIRRGD